MGMAASQARLLSLTARIHDVEYQAQQIQSRKLQLATLEDEAYRKYNDALDAKTLTFTNDTGTLVPATYNNLCGKNSINNGMNKFYVFRTGDTDQLIVPDEVYEGYQKFDGDDPYAFAMYMMGIDTDTLKTAETSYMKEVYKNNDDVQESLREIARKIAAEYGKNKEEQDEFAIEVVDGDGTQIDDLLPVDRENPHYQPIKKLVDEYHQLENQYRTKLYLSGGGADNIYKRAIGDEDAEFDNGEFQYYLRWGMLIDQEVGIDNCVEESEYGEGFGDDREMLNGMLQSGRMIVDTVEIDKKAGGIKDSTTSVAADERLAYTPVSTIDKTELAKAEAEYEHTMKEIDRKDKRYDMDLNKLETERTALTTEYDSVKKVIQDNIDRTFKIFS